MRSHGRTGIRRMAALAATVLVATALAVSPPSLPKAIAGCCFPCSTVFDTQVFQKVYQWYQNYAKPYVDRMKADYEAKLKQRMTPGIYGQMTSRIMGVMNTHSIERVSSGAQSTSRKVLAQYAPLNAKASNDDIGALNRSHVGRHYAANAYAIGEDAYRQSLETDTALQTVQPSAIDFKASSGIKKDMPKMAMIHGGIQASLLRVIAAREAYHAATAQ